MEWVKTGAIAVCAIAVGTASAVLAVNGSGDFLDRHPTGALVFGILVAAGVALPPIGGRLAERSRLQALSIQEVARWHLDVIRERIVSTATGIALEDIGVHFYLRRRRTFVPWRHEYVRYARAAKPSRSPEPSHAVWAEDWRTGLADGLIGFAVETDSLIAVDLNDPDHDGIGEREWTGWYANRDPRCLGVPWSRAQKPLRWFSTVWAEPVPAPDGTIVGVITLNIESEIRDGYHRLMEADAPVVLHETARHAGFALVGIS